MYFLNEQGYDAIENDIVELFLLQIFWAFSIYLEAVAILPQLVLLQRSGNVDNLTSHYVFFLGFVYFPLRLLVLYGRITFLLS